MITVRNALAGSCVAALTCMVTPSMGEPGNGSQLQNIQHTEKPIYFQPSRERLATGFKQVRYSAERCLERYNKRQDDPIEMVRVVLTIERSGRVSGMEIDGVLQRTSFASCMRSHSGRWNFPSFTGPKLRVAQKLRISTDTSEP